MTILSSSNTLSSEGYGTCSVCHSVSEPVLATMNQLVYEQAKCVNGLHSDLLILL